MFTGDIPSEWRLDEASDSELAVEGDSIVFLHTDPSTPLACRVTAVKDESTHLDFLGEVVKDDDEELESLWLSSADYPTVSHTREEILEWLTEKLEEYKDY